MSIGIIGYSCQLRFILILCNQCDYTSIISIILVNNKRSCFIELAVITNFPSNELLTFISNSRYSNNDRSCSIYIVVQVFLFEAAELSRIILNCICLFIYPNSYKVCVFNNLTVKTKHLSSRCFPTYKRIAIFYGIYRLFNCITRNNIYRIYGCTIVVVECYFECYGFPFCIKHQVFSRHTSCAKIYDFAVSCCPTFKDISFTIYLF